MNNYIQPGDVVTLTAPYAVASGAGMLVGSLFAVATSAAANGAKVEAKTTGVCDLAALSTDTATVGAKLYWDNTNKRLTTTASGNSLVGVALVDKASGETTARVRLNGVSI